MREEYEFPIEDNVPLPPWVKIRDKYPWTKLQPGQSFLVPCEVKNVDKLMNSLTSCRGHAERKLNWQFALRRTNKGVRVWRVR